MTSEAAGQAGEGGPPDEDLEAPSFDVSVAHQARIYDYWLGGKDNYAADRKAAELAVQAYPAVATGARANRQFLARAVRHMADQGIRQFLDLGTGIPSANNTHEVAQRVAPESRVVYVDYDRSKSSCSHGKMMQGDCLPYRPVAAPDVQTRASVGRREDQRSLSPVRRGPPMTADSQPEKRRRD